MYSTVDDGSFILQTIDERIAAQDHPTALSLLARHFPLLASMQGEELRATITGIPENAWRLDPLTHAAVGASHCGAGSVATAAALPWFTTAERLARRGQSATLPGILVFHAQALRSLGLLDDASRKLALAESLLEADISLSPSARISLQAKSAAQAGLIALHRGEFEQARHRLNVAASLDTQLTPAERVELNAGRALLTAITGEYTTSAEYIALARRHSGDSSLMTSRLGAAATIAETLIAIHRFDRASMGDLKPALAAITDFVEWLPFARYVQGLVALVATQNIEALERARQAGEALQNWQGETIVRALCSCLRTSTLIQMGSYDGAASAAASADSTALHAHCAERLHASVSLRRGAPAEALAHLAACETLGDSHALSTMLDVFILSAAARYELGDHAQADVAFDRALHLAHSTGIRSHFSVVAAPTMVRMLGRAADRNQTAGAALVLEELRAAMGAAAPRPEEQLSDRELVIAHHLSLDKTVSQIAGELYISSNTVKTHVRSIYRKLQASNRKQAMSRVKELGITL